MHYEKIMSVRIKYMKMGIQKAVLLFNKIPNNLVTIIMLKMSQEIIIYTYLL